MPSALHPIFISSFDSHITILKVTIIGGIYKLLAYFDPKWHPYGSLQKWNRNIPVSDILKKISINLK